MKPSPRQLNRATLYRQLLLTRQPLAVADGVRRVTALQAQEPASPYIALWNRLEGFDPAELDAAFADGSLVKASLMRITLHAVHADDYPHFHDAMQPTLRAARLNDDRFRAAGLTIEQADALVQRVVEFASRPRSNAEFEAWLDEQLGVLPKPGVWWALRTYGPFVHAPTGGAWSFGPRPAYVAARDLERAGQPDVSLQVLVRRYLEGFGPASLHDIAQFALVARVRARRAVAGLADGLVQLEGPDGVTLYDLPDQQLPDEDTPAPARLLPMWDSTLLAHADRSRIVPDEYRRLVIRSNGDVLPSLMVDGYVCGVWRPVDEGIEATSFRRLPDVAWEELAGEARRLNDFLSRRDPQVYRRYARWWNNLPAAETRILA